MSYIAAKDKLYEWPKIIFLWVYWLIRICSFEWWWGGVTFEIFNKNWNVIDNWRYLIFSIQPSQPSSMQRKTNIIILLSAHRKYLFWLNSRSSILKYDWIQFNCPIVRASASSKIFLSNYRVEVIIWGYCFCGIFSTNT